MQKLLDFFQKNPYILLFSTALGLIGGVIGIVTGWTQFYAVLKTETTIPGWVILMVLMVFLGILSVKREKVKETEPETLVKYEGKTFGIQTIALDGKEFIRCEFNGTKLIYSGGPFGLQYCVFTDFSLGLDGDAQRTLAVLTLFYQQYPVLRPMIDQTFENVRTGNHPMTPPTTQL